MSDDDKNISLAKIAEQAERYEDMSEYMKEYMTNDNGVGAARAEHRNLLSVAFKNVVGTKRSAWRILNSQREGKDDPLVADYIKKVAQELKEVCNTVLVRAVAFLHKNASSRIAFRAGYSKLCSICGVNFSFVYRFLQPYTWL